MRKVFYFLTFISALGYSNVQAQYSQVTATSGVQVIAGVTTVTVTKSTPAPNIGNYCGTGPYQIGKNYSDWYNYAFSGSVTHVRFEMTRIHNDDTLRFDINGTQYNVTNANLTPFAGTCTMTSNNMITPGGLLGTTGGATGAGQGIQVDIQITPNVINSVRVTHIRSPFNNIASDVYYNMYVRNDSCSLGFIATVDSPACSGRDIQLDVTNFPGTTYSWTTNAFNTPNWSPSPNVRNPKLLAATQAHSGKYVVTGTRGVCVYKDSVNVLVGQSPVTGPVKQTGPVCPNFDDTILVPLVNLPIGGWVIAYGKWGIDTFDASQGYILVFKNIQKSQATFYNIYAVDIQGCVSDTAVFPLKVKEDVTAAFSYTVKEGCDQDSVDFLDLSSSDAGSYVSTIWNFGDNTPPVSAKDTTHYYKVPKPNYDPRDYDVTMAVTNGQCFDTVTQRITINHPVKAKYVLDDDSLCQGETVNFVAGDSSYVKAGTIPHMLWVFGDGATDTVFDVSHTYDKYGLYYPTFIMTDFLGCSDSFKLPVVVDSSGYVSFETDKVDVCVGEEILFSGRYSQFGYTSATWDFADGVIINDSTLVHHSYDKPGKYQVKFDIVYRLCPNVSYSGEYNVKPVPSVYLGEDTAICPNGEPIFIQDIYNPGNPDNIKYSWNTPTKDVTPGIYVHHHGIYSVTADLNGCTAADTLVVSKNCYINIPNAFTPNGDGNSDYFLPRQMLSRNVTKFEMQVYNRWGEKVFETTSVNGRGWDGKYGGDDQPTGVYIYMIQVTFANGINERYQGNVTLLR